MGQLIINITRSWVQTWSVNQPPIMKQRNRFWEAECLSFSKFEVLLCGRHCPAVSTWRSRPDPSWVGASLQKTLDMSDGRWRRRKQLQQSGGLSCKDKCYLRDFFCLGQPQHEGIYSIHPGKPGEVIEKELRFFCSVEKCTVKSLQTQGRKPARIHWDMRLWTFTVT